MFYISGIFGFEFPLCVCVCVCVFVCVSVCLCVCALACVRPSQAVPREAAKITIIKLGTSKCLTCQLHRPYSLLENLCFYDCPRPHPKLLAALHEPRGSSPTSPGSPEAVPEIPERFRTKHAAPFQELSGGASATDSGGSEDLSASSSASRASAVNVWSIHLSVRSTDTPRALDSSPGGGHHTGTAPAPTGYLTPVSAEVKAALEECQLDEERGGGGGGGGTGTLTGRASRREGGGTSLQERGGGGGGGTPTWRASREGGGTSLQERGGGGGTPLTGLASREGGGTWPEESFSPPPSLGRCASESGRSAEGLGLTGAARVPGRGGGRVFRRVPGLESNPRAHASSSSSCSSGSALHASRSLPARPLPLLEDEEEHVYSEIRDQAPPLPHSPRNGHEQPKKL